MKMSTRYAVYGASWSDPPMDAPAYYLCYNKPFNRTGGQMRYVTADNRDFLLARVRGLEK
jgi:hypothetical protein